MVTGIDVGAPWLRTSCTCVCRCSGRGVKMGADKGQLCWRCPPFLVFPELGITSVSGASRGPLRDVSPFSVPSPCPCPLSVSPLRVPAGAARSHLPAGGAALQFRARPPGARRRRGAVQGRGAGGAGRSCPERGAPSADTGPGSADTGPGVHHEQHQERAGTGAEPPRRAQPGGGAGAVRQEPGKDGGRGAAGPRDRPRLRSRF